MHAEVRKYIDEAPEEHQPLLEELRALIMKRVPSFEESFAHGFPVYLLSGRELAGFATRKKGVMFYLMNSRIVAARADELGTLVEGKSCVAYRETGDLSRAELRRIFAAMLDEVARPAD